MTAKQYLQQVRKLDSEINLHLETISAIRDSLYVRAVSYDNIPVSHCSHDDPIGKAISKITDYEKEVNDKINRLVELKIAIIKTIRCIPDIRYRKLLTKYYVEGKSWEQVAEEMNYGIRHIHKLHGNALLLIEKMALNGTITL